MPSKNYNQTTKDNSLITFSPLMDVDYDQPKENFAAGKAESHKEKKMQRVDTPVMINKSSKSRAGIEQHQRRSNNPLTHTNGKIDFQQTKDGKNNVYFSVYIIFIFIGDRI